MLKNDLMKSEIVSSSVPTNSNQKKRKQLQNMKGSILSTEDPLALYPDGQRLSYMVDELGRLVDA